MTATLTGTAYIEPFLGTWQNSDTTGTGTAATVSGVVPPKLKITLNDVVKNGIITLNSDINAKTTEILTSKASIPSKQRVYLVNLDSQQDKLKAMNMSLVLYDEIPEYTQSSADAIKGNTYSRINGCQFKRI